VVGRASSLPSGNSWNSAGTILYWFILSFGLYQQGQEGTRCPGSSSSPYIPPRLLAHWRGHASVVTRLRQNTESNSYRLKVYSDWRRKPAPGAPFDGGRDHRVSLDSYRPPQALQPPASKVLSRYSLPALLGAHGLGTYPPDK
jgi:hypothetical protein